VGCYPIDHSQNYQEAHHEETDPKANHQEDYQEDDQEDDQEAKDHDNAVLRADYAIVLVLDPGLLVWQ